jgi:hypothetical protein
LIKLYSQSDRRDLEAFITAGEIDCDFKDCLDWLQKCNCHHAMALLYRHYHNYEMAFQIWAKILTGELQDDSFEGLEIFVDTLSK